MKSIGEAARLAGISVRALRHYDKTGLLRPSTQTGAGYRMYDEAALCRLQQILFFKELGFPLKKIKELLDGKGFDRNAALKAQRELLMLKKKRIEELITLTEKNLKGETDMSFKQFDSAEIEAAKKKYAAEAKSRWGGTPEYEESKKKTDGYSQSDWQRLQQSSKEIFEGFVRVMDKGPGSPEAAEQVRRWQSYISDSFYPCSNEILASLGRMYVDDPRFTENIDKYQKGLAAFMSAAIEAYCNEINK